EPLRIDVVEGQLVDVERVLPEPEALDQLRRVGAPPSDDGDFHSSGILRYSRVTMKSLGKFPDIFAAEIAGQPDALRRAGEALADQHAAVEELRRAARGDGGVLFTGMGSSYDACYPAVTALSGRGVPCAMLDTAELLHFRLPQLRPDMLLICVSQSGESAELVRLAERLEGAGRPPLPPAPHPSHH